MTLQQRRARHRARPTVAATSGVTDQRAEKGSPPMMTTTTTTTDTTNDDLPPELMLKHLRAARTRAQLAACELDTIGTALRQRAITVDQALAWARDVDALKYLLGPEAADSEVAA
ncbi:MAG: hypothetical protein WBX05_00970 [Pseudolabrys sp.]